MRSKRIVIYLLIIIMIVGWVMPGFANAADIQAQIDALQAQLADIEKTPEPIPTQTPAPITVIPVNNEEQVCQIGELILIEELCEFTVTGYKVVNSYGDKPNEYTHKYLILNVRLLNYSLETLFVDKLISATVTYKEKYNFSSIGQYESNAFESATLSIDQNNIDVSTKLQQVESRMPLGEYINTYYNQELFDLKTFTKIGIIPNTEAFTVNGMYENRENNLRYYLVSYITKNNILFDGFISAGLDTFFKPVNVAEDSNGKDEQEENHIDALDEGELDPLVEKNYSIVFRLPNAIVTCDEYVDESDAMTILKIKIENICYTFPLKFFTDES